MELGCPERNTKFPISDRIRGLQLVVIVVVPVMPLAVPVSVVMIVVVLVVVGVVDLPTL